MSVAVIPQLDTLLRERNLTVAELKRQIEAQFHFPVDVKTLYRLTSTRPVQRTHLPVAGAAARILGVELGDLLQVEVTRTQADGSPAALAREQSERMAELFARQARQELAADEQAELNRLVEAYAEALTEQRLREYAERAGLSLAEARARAGQELHRALGQRAADRRPRRRPQPRG